MIEIIVSGLSIIASVTGILQYKRAQSAGRDAQALEASIRRIQQRAVTLGSIISNRVPSAENDAALLAAYEELLRELKGDRYYAAHLKFRPTGYGVSQLEKKKPTIVRDERGEFGEPSR